MVMPFTLLLVGGLLFGTDCCQSTQPDAKAGEKFVVVVCENTNIRIIQQDPNDMMLKRDELDVPPSRKYDFKF